MWEALEKHIRKTFEDSVSSLCRELPVCMANAEVERQLFKAVVAVAS